MQDELSRIFGRNVDLVTRAAVEGIRPVCDLVVQGVFRFLRAEQARRHHERYGADLRGQWCDVPLMRNFREPTGQSVGHRIALAKHVLRVQPRSPAGPLVGFKLQGAVLEMGDLPAHSFLDRRLDLVEFRHAPLPHFPQVTGHQVGDRKCACAFFNGEQTFTVRE